MEPTVHTISDSNTTRDVLREEDDVTVITPSITFFKHIIEVLSNEFEHGEKGEEIQREQPVTVYVTRETLSSVRGEFLYESVLAELIRDDVVVVEKINAEVQNIVLTPETAYSALVINSSVALFSTTDEDVISVSTDMVSQNEQTRVMMDDVLTYSDITQHLSEVFDETFVTVFETAVDEMLQHGEEIPIQHVFVLVAAFENKLQKTLSQALGDVNVISIASVSRTKNKLQDEGVIETTKMPIDVGRPQHRLILSPTTEENTDTIRDVIRYTIEELRD